MSHNGRSSLSWQRKHELLYWRNEYKDGTSDATAQCRWCEDRTTRTTQTLPLREKQKDGGEGIKGIMEAGNAWIRRSAPECSPNRRNNGAATVPCGGVLRFSVLKNGRHSIPCGFIEMEAGLSGPRPGHVHHFNIIDSYGIRMHI